MPWLADKFANRKVKIAATAGLLAVAALAIYLASRGPKAPVVTTNNDKPSTIIVDDEPIELPDVNPDITQFGLEIPLLSIKVPVIADVDLSNEKRYQAIVAKLGIAQMEGTKLPTEKGNLFLFGHSSFWLNYPGEYKQVFKELDKLKKDEKFTVYYKGATYEYTVMQNKIVADDDFSVLDPTPNDANDSTITIMTCWPPGTSQKRLVVFGKRI